MENSIEIKITHMLKATCRLDVGMGEGPRSGGTWIVANPTAMAGFNLLFCPLKDQLEVSI
jgi:hypothetical protein